MPITIIMIVGKHFEIQQTYLSKTSIDDVSVLLFAVGKISAYRFPPTKLQMSFQFRIRDNDVKCKQ